MGNSFQYPLPWANCPSSANGTGKHLETHQITSWLSAQWEKGLCGLKEKNERKEREKALYPPPTTCMLVTVVILGFCLHACIPLLLFLSHSEVKECAASSPTTYFWFRKALDVTDSIDETGQFNSIMTGCLLAAWAIVCLGMFRGIKSSGKVIWFCTSLL